MYKCLVSCKDNYTSIILIVKIYLTIHAEYDKKELKSLMGVCTMTGEERRLEILRRLQETGTPLSGAALAKAFHVSRQIIVQDIALMRAENYGIISTNKGYLLRTEKNENSQPKRVFYIRHSTQQVLDEFQTVIELGGKILDVAVEHEIYGQIRADLLIETAQDAMDFYKKLIACRDNPLKVLTDDCHYHTVAAPSEKLLDLIEDELRKKNYLL